MFGYFEKRPVVRWNLPSENRPGLGLMDGVLPLAAQVEMGQRATAARLYQAAMHSRDGVRLDPVLRAHLALEAFGEKRDS
jgi:hypothetical protein